MAFQGRSQMLERTTDDTLRCLRDRHAIQQAPMILEMGDQNEREAEVQRSLGRIEGKLDAALEGVVRAEVSISQVKEHNELSIVKLDSRVKSLEKAHWKTAGMVGTVSAGATFIVGPLWEWLKTHLK